VAGGAVVIIDVGGIPNPAPAGMSRRFQSLDGLRGIAAIMIVLFHVRWSNHLTETHFVREAYLFVDLFFILSGFIITKAYGDRIHALHQAGGFLILRFFRVYPLHIAVLSVFVFYELAKLAAIHAGLPAQPFQQSNAGWTLLANVFLLQCLVVLGAPAWNVPSWSISCEAVAYVLFAAAAMADYCGDANSSLGRSSPLVSATRLSCTTKARCLR
jgi:peptidoglycan/LPS O-acetylase OafA/YrhL